MENSFFFESEEVEDLVMSQAEKLFSLQDKETKRILKSYKRVRQELRDRLDAFSDRGMDESYSAHRTRSALVQIEVALSQIEKDMNDEFSSSGLTVAEQGVQDLITSLDSWNEFYLGAVTPINLDAMVIATDTNNFLFNRREASLKAYTAFQRQEFARSLSDAIAAQKNYSEVVSDIGRYMMAEEWRLERLVRTELHNIYSQSKISGMNELVDTSMPDLKKTLFHPMDRRTGKDSVRLSQNNPIVGVNEMFVESSTGKRLEYFAPPNRPNDRAILIPFRDSWKNPN